VADRYIDEAYYQAHLGSGYTSAALAVAGIDADVLIEASTALVKSAMKNSGYERIATQDPDEVDELAKFATLEVFRWKLANIPEAQLTLPENWETSIGGQMVAKIISGEYPMPSLEPDPAGAVGGALFTDVTNDANSSRKTTRTELAGY
jgi:hypothetical protein